LEENAGRIRAQGLGLAAISYDSVAVLKQFADRAHINFPLLSDPDSAAIRRYGILNEAVPKENAFFGIPHPGTYVLDGRGVVTAKFFEEDYRVRDTAASILLRQFGLKTPKQEAIEAKHATLRAWVSDGALRPGQRLTLSLDVSLPQRVHVYAPGVQGYKPVALKLSESRAFQPDAPVFPKSKTVRLAAIQETVPVYEGQFRLLQTITLSNAQQVEALLDKDRQLVIEGQFLYQACDDRQCFVPETVPLRWVVKVMPFDRTRAPVEMQRQSRK
jgi:hypothetical protein